MAVELERQLQAEAHQGLSATTKSWESGRGWILSQSLQRGMALPILWFQTFTSRTVRE